MKLGAFVPKHGTKVTLKNRKGPSIETLSQSEIEKLKEVDGELCGSQWRTCVGAVAFVVTVERGRNHV